MKSLGVWERGIRGRDRPASSLLGEGRPAILDLGLLKTGGALAVALAMDLTSGVRQRKAESQPFFMSLKLGGRLRTLHFITTR